MTEETKIKDDETEEDKVQQATIIARLDFACGDGGPLRYD